MLGCTRVAAVEHELEELVPVHVSFAVLEVPRNFRHSVTQLFARTLVCFPLQQLQSKGLGGADYSINIGVLIRCAATTVQRIQHDVRNDG